MHRVGRGIIGDAEIQQAAEIAQFEIGIARYIIDRGIGCAADAVGQGCADIKGLADGCGRQRVDRRGGTSQRSEAKGGQE